MNAQAATDLPFRAWPPDETLPRFSIRSDTGMLMETSITAGLEALRRRGLEVGGLLLGSSSGDEVIVDSLEPVMSLYPEGPSYRVPGQDLAAALATPGEREIVGFYRSRTDGKLELDEQDRLLLRLLPRNGPVAILLVRQTKQTPAEARLGFDVDGTIVWSKSTVPFAPWLAGTVDPAALAESPGAGAQNQEVPSPMPLNSDGMLLMTDPRGRLVAVPVAANDPEAPFRRRWRRVLGAGAAVAAVGFLIAVVSRDPSVDDRSRSVVMDKIPVLQESEAAKQIAALLPPRPDVTGDVPAVAAAPPDRVETARVVPSASPGRSRVRIPEAPATATLSRPPVERPRGGTDSGGEEVREPGSPPAVAVPVIVPAVSMTLPQTVLAPPPRSPQISMTAPTASVPSAMVASVQFVPPVLSRQSSPVIVPPDLRRIIQHEVVLSLRVAVDKTGNVISITSVNRLDRTEQALARSYSAAIQTWQFDPAKRNGEPVSGETILNFRITPGTQRQQ